MRLFEADRISFRGRPLGTLQATGENAPATTDAQPFQPLCVDPFTAGVTFGIKASLHQLMRLYGLWPVPFSRADVAAL